MKHVSEVCEGELQGVLTLGELEFDLGLALSVVEAFSFNTGDGSFRIELAGIHVDQQVVVASVLKMETGGADSHSFEPKPDCDRALDGFAILESHDVDAGSLGGGRFQGIGKSGGCGFVLSRAKGEGAHEGDSSE